MDNILGLFEKLESQSLAVQPSRCVVVRNRNASCRRCAEACPTGAILVEGNDLAVAPERCIGCGTCATVCPTAALESKKPDDKGLLKAAVAAMQANDGVAVVMDEAMQAAAEGKYDPAKVVAVKSLARVDESLIAVLAAGGASSVVLVAGPPRPMPTPRPPIRWPRKPPTRPPRWTPLSTARPGSCATRPPCCWRPGAATSR